MSDDKDNPNFDNVVWATFRKPEEPLTIEEMYARLISDFEQANDQWQKYCNFTTIASYNQAIENILPLIKDQELWNEISQMKLPELDDVEAFLEAASVEDDDIS